MLEFAMRIEVLWAVPLLPLAGVGVAYAAVRQRWHVFWFVTLGLIPSNTFLWVVALFLASIYSSKQFISPITVAMIVSTFCSLFLRLKIAPLAKNANYTWNPRFL
jgi:FtsH-binding integral membrane protein